MSPRWCLRPRSPVVLRPDARTPRSCHTPLSCSISSVVAGRERDEKGQRRSGDRAVREVGGGDGPNGRRRPGGGLHALPRVRRPCRGAHATRAAPPGRATRRARRARRPRAQRVPGAARQRGCVGSGGRGVALELGGEAAGGDRRGLGRPARRPARRPRPRSHRAAPGDRRGAPMASRCSSGSPRVTTAAPCSSRPSTGAG